MTRTRNKVNHPVSLDQFPLKLFKKQKTTYDLRNLSARFSLNLSLLRRFRSKFFPVSLTGNQKLFFPSQVLQKLSFSRSVLKI